MSSRSTNSLSGYVQVYMFFFFNDTATTEIYTLSLHDALPISPRRRSASSACAAGSPTGSRRRTRSEEHTSELQSRRDLVCRLLLEKKKKNKYVIPFPKLLTCHGSKVESTVITFLIGFHCSQIP